MRAYFALETLDLNQPDRNDQFSDRVLIALRRIIRRIDLHSRKLLRQFGLTGPQLIVLRETAARGELSCSALARAVSVSLPTMTGIVTRLEFQGLVARHRSSSDKRQVLVSITNAGRQILQVAPPPLQETFTRQLEALEEWEQTQVLAVLQRVVTMMEAEELEVSPVLATGDLAEPTSRDVIDDSESHGPEAKGQSRASKAAR